MSSVALGRAEQLVSQAEVIDASDLAVAKTAERLWEQARSVVDEASAAVAGAGGTGLAARVHDRAQSVQAGFARARRDAALLGSLEAARGADSGTIGGLPDRGASVRMCRTALTEAGLPAGGDAASLAAALRAERPGLRAALVAAP